MNDTRVSKGNIVSALIGSFRRDWRDLMSNRAAFAGGVGGTALVSAGLIAFFAFTHIASADDDELDMDFVPGALVKLGEPREEKEVVDKIVTEETRVEEDTAKETVTEEETPKPDTPPPEKKKEEKKVDKRPKPQPKKDSKLPTSKLPTTKNTPFDDLPTVDHNIGDPFGDPQGWSERAEAGDPWATNVMKALNNMPVGTYAAKARDGTFKFQLTICKDGRVERINRKGGTLDSDTQRLVELELERLKIPRPPADVLKLMKSNCAKIPYVFVWSARGVK